MSKFLLVKLSSPFPAICSHLSRVVSFSVCQSFQPLSSSLLVFFNLDSPFRLVRTSFCQILLLSKSLVALQRWLFFCQVLLFVRISGNVQAVCSSFSSHNMSMSVVPFERSAPVSQHFWHLPVDWFALALSDSLFVKNPCRLFRAACSRFLTFLASLYFLSSGMLLLLSFCSPCRRFCPVRVRVSSSSKSSY